MLATDLLLTHTALHPTLLFFATTYVQMPASRNRKSLKATGLSKWSVPSHQNFRLVSVRFAGPKVEWDSVGGPVVSTILD
jgi:hypothetical protein